MKSLLQVLTLLVCVFLVVSNLDTVAERFGIVRLNHETVLQNKAQLKVNCRLYAWGWVDKLELENEYQQCINNYQAQGYKVIEPLTHEQEVSLLNEG